MNSLSSWPNSWICASRSPSFLIKSCSWHCLARINTCSELSRSISTRNVYNHCRMTSNAAASTWWAKTKPSGRLKSYSETNFTSRTMRLLRVMTFLCLHFVSNMFAKYSLREHRMHLCAGNRRPWISNVTSLCAPLLWSLKKNTGSNAKRRNKTGRLGREEGNRAMELGNDRTLGGGVRKFTCEGTRCRRSDA